MKKVLILFGILLISSLPAISEENNASQVANDNRATISVQKQPATESHKQEINQNKWCIILQINGKIKEEKK